jgi:hypothetical protein
MNIKMSMHKDPRLRRQSMLKTVTITLEMSRPGGEGGGGGGGNSTLPVTERKQTPAWNISAHATQTPDSPTISSALASTNKDKWHEAVDKEVSALEDAGNWTMVPHQPGMNILRSHLVLKAKRDTAGAIIKDKARLVAGVMRC